MTDTPRPPSLLDLEPAQADLLDEVHDTLSNSPPALPCKLFYDERGSKLFDAICELQEYYPTRTEVQILRTYGKAILDLTGHEVRLVEFGSGSSLKTRLLLEQLAPGAIYVPIDISRDHLDSTARELQRDFPDIEVLPVCADYTAEPADLPGERGWPTVVFFPGSTIGNFEREDAVEFLVHMKELAGEDGAVLIGVDLRKDAVTLEAAYDDSEGTTALFNHNILVRLNRELGADFDLDGWKHRAHWDAEEGRIEMQLVCQTAQTVTVGGQQFSFEPGEFISTEFSHKYSVPGFARLAENAGLRVERVFTDPDNRFSVQLLRPAH